jgi:hypothetical protein
MTAASPESPPHYGPPEAAGPPPGPGAAPPFAAPPIEGRTARVWLGIGAAALAVVLFCGGGIAAIIGLSVANTRAVGEQSRAVITDYLDAIGKDDFGKAYDQLCERLRRQESQQSFEQRVRAEPKIRTYRIGQASGTNVIEVPVDITYVDGMPDRRTFSLVADSAAGLRICGIS